MTVRLSLYVVAQRFDNMLMQACAFNFPLCIGMTLQAHVDVHMLMCTC